MFAGYKITLKEAFFSDIFSDEESFHDIGTSIYKNYKTKVKESLDSYLLHNNKTISAAKLDVLYMIMKKQKILPVMYICF